MQQTKQTIKKMVSRLGLQPRQSDEQEARRNITPPSSTNPNDTNTTPPLQTHTSGLEDTPGNVLLQTPRTPLDAKAPAKSKSVWGRSRNKGQREPNPKDLEAGVTGADLTLPIFDGTSTNPDDHLIDLDTPSMESCPDVRVYFKYVGVKTHKDGVKPPKNPAELIAYHATRVRQGREYLKAARDRGDGFWLSPKRDILANNKPGSRWYRLPTAEIVYNIFQNGGETFEEEGYTHDGEKELEVEEGYCSVIMTNIRIPILWAEAYREGIVPGTRGWDSSILYLYECVANPFYLIRSGCSFDEVIFGLMVSSASATESEVCDRSEVERLIRRDWPDLKRPWFRSEHTYDDPRFTDLPNNTMDQFLMRSG